MSFPRVLQVLPSLKSGGVERGAIDIATYLKERGRETFIASSGGPLCELLEKQSIQHFVAPLHSKNPIEMFQNITRLKSIIQKHKIDIVHARSRAPAWSAFYATKQANVPFLTTYHAPYNAQNFLKKHYNSVMARGYRIIAISEFVKKHVIDSYQSCKWFNPDFITRIHRGIDIEAFKQSLTQTQLEVAEEWRKKLEISPQDKVLILPGRVTHWKGHALTVEAVSLLPKAVKQRLKVLFVGDMEKRLSYVNVLNALIEKKGLRHVFYFIPHHPDPAPFYYLSDIVLSPSTEPEGFGRIIAEAGAMYKPVLGANHGGAAEIIEPEVTGWVFEPCSAKDFCEKLEKVFFLPKKVLQNAGIQGRTRVETFFSKKQFCEKTYAFYYKAYSYSKKRT